MLPEDMLLVDTELPARIFEVSVGIRHNLADLCAVIDGEPEPLMVPEGNLLGANRA